jgi:glycopeptide antibiotics resistance protein
LKYFQNHGFWRLMLVALLVPLALIALWPSPVDAPVQGQLARILKFLHAHGIPRWVNYKFVEASANVLLFLPLGAVGWLAFPQIGWWRIGILALITSGCIELSQLLFLNNRFASPLDVVTNTGGAVIGALLVAAAHQRLQARRLSPGGP